MKLYVLTRIYEVDYDEFDCFCVLANSEDEAYELCSEYAGNFYNRNNLTIKEVDISLNKPMILCSSFNAG